jgi:MazG family protein
MRSARTALVSPRSIGKGARGGDSVAGIERLLGIMARLRNPQGGCPWDLEQSFETIAPYTLEEAFEVDDAIRRGDRAALREELGDLLLQVVFHAQLAREEGSFDFAAVVDAICDKLVHRHPHVFGTQEIGSAEAQLENWEKLKREERAARAAAEGLESSALDDVPLALPALLRIAKLQRRAERAGFDLDRDLPLCARVESELAKSGDVDLGDLLFAVTRAATRRGLEAETLARAAAARFETRFRKAEQSRA